MNKVAEEPQNRVCSYVKPSQVDCKDFTVCRFYDFWAEKLYFHTNCSSHILPAI